MHFSFKKFLPHILILVGFVIISLVYFSPVLQGKQIFQSDIKQYIGMSKQQTDFRQTAGEETYWTNSAFGGMPTYQLGAKYPNNFIKKLDLSLRFLPRPADYLFLYLLGFYILLLVLKVDFKLAALGALAFGFSTYLIIILGVGHNAKAHAIAYMPLVLSGIILTFRQHYVFGFLLTAVSMGLELVANHFQMTYYLMFLVIVLGVSYFIDAYKKNLLPHFFKSVGLLVLAVVLAIGLNATNIMATQEYAKESTRSQSELTINEEGVPIEVTSGLSKEYITEYSYGILESLNLFIPRILGGGSYEDVGKNSASYDFFIRLGATPLQALEQTKQIPTYWGDQTIVEAPAYVGAVIIFLFVFALFLVKGRLKWWLVGGTLLSLFLSYGKNLGFLTDFFIDYIPMYNKFRAVSSIQVILELCIPVLGIFGLVRLFNRFEDDNDKLKALKYSAGITAGLAILLLLFKSSFDFVGAHDGMYRQSYGQQFIDAIKADREMLFNKDTWRTLILVLLSAGVIFMYLKKKLSETIVVISFGVLILFDLIGVDRRYVNNDDFVPSIQVNKPYQQNAADQEILKDTTHFRVFDVTSGGARASYFHNSLSGYHAAKLKRYDELFDFHIAKNNLDVLNMLNTKYVIIEGEQGKPVAETRYTQPNGNAWFIETFKPVETANEEILALDSLDTKRKAVLNVNKDADNLNASARYTVTASAKVEVLDYKPNYIKYQSNNPQDGFVIFSEIYYAKGWQVYIDGEQSDYTRVNYVLRGMQVPAGKHIIEFKFEPEVIETGSSIALASSIALVLLLVGGLFYQFKNKSKT